MSSIRYHSERAAAERQFAGDSKNPGPAAIHVTLAEMHENLLAKDINDRLAPFKRSTSWRALARLITSRYFMVEALRSAFYPMQRIAKLRRLRVMRAQIPTAIAAMQMTDTNIVKASALV